VEGEGSLYLRLTDDEVDEVRLDIYEPPRYFEAFLRGRSYREPPDITARICGICPVAYQTSAALAIEAACGAQVEGPLADLRRLLYCGEWIASHSLHIYLLHAPDFLGYPGALELARDQRASSSAASRSGAPATRSWRRSAGGQSIRSTSGSAAFTLSPRRADAEKCELVRWQPRCAAVWVCALSRAASRPELFTWRVQELLPGSRVSRVTEGGGIIAPAHAIAARR
jgi:hypothetical protein